MPRLSRKTIIMVFHPGSAHACILRTRRTCRVPFLTSPFGLGIVVQHPWFICCYYFMQNIWLNFDSSQQIMKKISNRHAVGSTNKFFSTNFEQIFRIFKYSVRILRTAFLFKPVSSAIILTLTRRSFAITARTTSTFWSFVDEIGLPERGSSSTFLGPLWKLCAT